MFDMKNNAENKEDQAPKNAVKKPADEIPEDVLRGIVGGEADDDDVRPPMPSWD